MDSDRKLVDKLLHELASAELEACEHASREAKRIGDAPPALALREVAAHAAVMRPRFESVLAAHDLELGRHWLGATLATLRHVVADRIIDDERAFRGALLDLRNGVEIVKVLRDTARRVLLFGVIRWCDDWLAARRTLVARVEAQLAWYVERETLAEPLQPGGDLPDDDWHADRTT